MDLKNLTVVCIWNPHHHAYPPLFFFVFSCLHPYRVQKLFVSGYLPCNKTVNYWFSANYHFHFVQKWNPSGLRPCTCRWERMQACGCPSDLSQNPNFWKKLPLTRRLPPAPKCGVAYCVHGRTWHAHHALMWPHNTARTHRKLTRPFSCA